MSIPHMSSSFPPHVGEMTSYERDRPHRLNGTSSPMVPRPLSSQLSGSVNSPKRRANKRQRVESEIDDGRDDQRNGIDEGTSASTTDDNDVEMNTPASGRDVTSSSSTPGVQGEAEEEGNDDGQP